MHSKVDSGDSKNFEAQVAKIYFRIVFGDNFLRHSDSIASNALNYGYTIIRAYVARALVARGFLPCFGIFHSSELNAFNLADDVIEPFRPFIDYYVINNLNNPTDNSQLNLEQRQDLVNILYTNVTLGNEKIWLLNAIDRVVDSLSSAVNYNDYRLYKQVNFL